LFRIDRRLVNVADRKFSKLGVDEKPEAGAEVDELPDAAASVKSVSSAEDIVNEYLSAAKSETEAKIEALLEQARDQAAHIIFEAREDAEEEHKRAWQEGYQEGTEEGLRIYNEKVSAKIQEDDETLKRVLDEIYEEREKIYAGLETEVTNLSLEIVKKIINPAEDALGDVFTSLIKNALRQMSTDGKIVLRVGPVEYERFFSSGAATIELDSGVTVRASVLRDVSLQEGDLIIDTDDVTINAGIDSQLQFVELAFERANQYEPE